MKIAYVFHRDAADAAVQSGRPASILGQLQLAGCEILQAFPLSSPPRPGVSLHKILCRLTGKLYRGDRDPDLLESFAREFRKLTAGQAYDFVFSPGSEAISFITTPQPIVFCSDATFDNLVDYYWDFTSLAASYIRAGHAQEKAALSRAALAVYPSEWAARSAIDFYGADPAKVAVIPFGANFGAENQREEVEGFIRARPFSPLRLLFSGRHWTRKGGDIAVAVGEQLKARGFEVVLDVVGCEPPAKYRHVPWIVSHGLLDAQHPAEAELLTKLFTRAHFLLGPSRAEAFGMIFCEANAFGVPAIGTRTGGIPGIIRPGRNGLLFSLAASPQEYAEEIAAIFRDEARYQRLALSSYEEFATRLNWRTFCEQLLERVARVIKAPAVAEEVLTPR